MYFNYLFSDTCPIWKCHQGPAPPPSPAWVVDPWKTAFWLTLSVLIIIGVALSVWKRRGIFERLGSCWRCILAPFRRCGNCCSALETWVHRILGWEVPLHDFGHHDLQESPEPLHSPPVPPSTPETESRPGSSISAIFAADEALQPANAPRNDPRQGAAENRPIVKNPAAFLNVPL